MRRRAERPNDVCSYDFVFERTAAGRALKHLVVVDEYRRECLAIVVARRLPPTSALTTVPSSPPRRCLTGSSAWACRRSSSSLAAPGRMAASSRLRASSGDECLNRERFETLLEAQILSEQWRFAYNHLRPHSSLRYRPPAPSARPALRQSQLPLEVPVLSSEVVQRLGARQFRSPARRRR